MGLKMPEKGPWLKNGLAKTHKKVKWKTLPMKNAVWKNHHEVGKTGLAGIKTAAFSQWKIGLMFKKISAFKKTLRAHKNSIAAQKGRYQCCKKNYRAAKMTPFTVCSEKYCKKVVITVPWGKNVYRWLVSNTIIDQKCRVAQKGVPFAHEKYGSLLDKNRSFGGQKQVHVHSTLKRRPKTGQQLLLKRCILPLGRQKGRRRYCKNCLPLKMMQKGRYARWKRTRRGIIAKRTS